MSVELREELQKIKSLEMKHTLEATRIKEATLKPEIRVLNRLDESQ